MLPPDYRFILFFLVLIIAFSYESSAQNALNLSDSHANFSHASNIQQKDSISTDSIAYFYEPFPIVPGESILQLGGSFTLLPLPVVENEYPAPALDVQYKYGLYENMIIAVSLSTNYFSNLIHAGIQWNTNFNRFSIGIANDIGGFYGFINRSDQFDANTATAFFDLPILRMGYRFPHFSISMSWAVSYIFNSYNKVSGLTAEGPQKKINDFFCTLVIEQPFLEHSLISVGFSLNYARSPYQSWMLYNTLDQYLFLPEFFFAFQL